MALYFCIGLKTIMVFTEAAKEEETDIIDVTAHLSLRGT